MQAIAEFDVAEKTGFVGTERGDGANKHFLAHRNGKSMAHQVFLDLAFSATEMRRERRHEALRLGTFGKNAGDGSRHRIGLGNQPALAGGDKVLGLKG